MTRRLSRLADIAYRRRGRMVLAWIGAMILIIGVGSGLKGDFNADYNTPGSDSKAASDITEQRFGGYSGQEIYVVWKDPAGATSPGAQQRINAFFAEAEKVDNIAAHTQVRVSQNGQIGAATLPLTVPGWEVTKDQGTQLLDAADAHDGNGLDIKLGGDPIQRAESQSSPEGIGLFGAAIVLLIAFGSVVAAGRPRALARVGGGI
jgi:RND superfamily putative drug exporter